MKLLIATILVLLMVGCATPMTPEQRMACNNLQPSWSLGESLSRAGGNCQVRQRPIKTTCTTILNTTTCTTD